MNNRELVASIAAKMNLPKDEAEQLLDSFSEILSKKIQTAKVVDFDGIGSFELLKKDERVVEDYETGKRRLFPPQLVVVFNQDNKLLSKLNPLLERIKSSGDKSTDELIELLVKESQHTEERAELFIASLTTTIEDALLNGELVRIKGFGVYKSEWKEAAKSYNPATGETTITEGRYEVVFDADQELKATLNEPFAHLEPVTLGGEDVGGATSNVTSMELKSEHELLNPLQKFEEQVSEIKGLLSMINKPKFVENKQEELGNKTDNKKEMAQDSEATDRIAEQASDGPQIIIKGFDSDSAVVKDNLSNEDNQTNLMPDFVVVRDLSLRTNESVTAAASIEVESKVEPEPIDEQTLKVDESAALEPALTVDETIANAEEENTPTDNVLLEKEQENQPKPLKEKSVEEEGKERKHKKGKMWLWILFIILLLELLFVFLYFQTNERTKSLAAEKQDRLNELIDLAVQDVDVENISDSLNHFYSDEVLDTNALVVQEDKVVQLTEGLSVNSSEELHKADIDEGDKKIEEVKNTVVDLQELFKKPRAYKEFIATEKMVAGSQLTKFAKQYYGHSNFWVYIYEANKNKISNPDNVPAGIELKIPKLDKRLIDASNRECLEYALQLQREYLK